MIEFPSLPTDSLPKFLSVLGLFTAFVGGFGLYEMARQVLDEQDQQRARLTAVLAHVDSLRADNGRTAARLGTLGRVVHDRRDSTAALTQLRSLERSLSVTDSNEMMIRDSASRLISQVDQGKAQIRARELDLAEWAIVAGLVVFGIGVAWWWRIQAQHDALLRSQVRQAERQSEPVAPTAIVNSEVTTSERLLRPPSLIATRYVVATEKVPPKAYFYFWVINHEDEELVLETAGVTYFYLSSGSRSVDIREHWSTANLPTLRPRGEGQIIVEGSVKDYTGQLNEIPRDARLSAAVTVYVVGRFGSTPIRQSSSDQHWQGVIERPPVILLDNSELAEMASFEGQNGENIHRLLVNGEEKTLSRIKDNIVQQKASKEQR